MLGGSLVGSNGVFLRALYAAGIKGFYDGLSVHFYNLTLASLRSIHEVQLANGDTKPLWLDEFGWSSCWPRERSSRNRRCVTPQVQAANLTNTFRALARTPYVAAAVALQAAGLAQRKTSACSPRAERASRSFAALAECSPRRSAAPSPVTLQPAAARQSACVASGSGPVGDFMQLEAFQGGALRYRALFTLDRFNRYSLALPRCSARAACGCASSSTGPAQPRRAASASI